MHMQFFSFGFISSGSRNRISSFRISSLSFHSLLIHKPIAYLVFISFMKSCTLSFTLHTFETLIFPYVVVITDDFCCSLFFCIMLFSNLSKIQTSLLDFCATCNKDNAKFCYILANIPLLQLKSFIPLLCLIWKLPCKSTHCCYNS